MMSRSAVLAFLVPVLTAIAVVHQPISAIANDAAASNIRSRRGLRSRGRG